MKRIKRRLFALLLACTLQMSACGHASNGSVFTETELISETESESSMQENNEAYEGTLRFEESADGKTVTVSYVLNGQTVSYTVPNQANYLSGGYAGVDDLGRALPTSLTTGIYGANGEHYVGMFYFLWHGAHGDPGVYDLQKIMDEYGELAGNANAVDPDTGERLYGKVGDMHWFAEPLYGYYYASDEWVIRKHVELLTNANVDFLYLDVTNGYIYKETALKLMKVCHEWNEAGFDAPQIVFYTNTNSAGVMQQLYEQIYCQNLYPDTWFLVDGKPCIVGVEEGNINGFFTVKTAQWPTEANKPNGWPWMDFVWPQRVFEDGAGNPDAISVSVAQHNRSITFSDSSLYGYAYNRGRSFGAAVDSNAEMLAYREAYDADPSLTVQGINFQAQWDRAIEADVPYVLVTGWNEWVAQRQDGKALRGDENLVYFVDTASMEFSRDIEMMRGGYFDNYYMQLIANVQRLKGSAPVLIQDARNPIDVTGAFSQWDAVPVSYVDPAGDCKHRASKGFGGTNYRNDTGRNDIVCAKVTNDRHNAYFYVSTAEDISTEWREGSSWMNLFLNADNNTQNGWYGYDYVINYAVKGEGVTSVAKCAADADGKLVCTEIGEVSYKMEGNELMIAVPLELLGVTDCEQIYFEFKWADAMDHTYRTMESFYTCGDVAPLGRLNWIYQNYVPKA